MAAVSELVDKLAVVATLDEQIGPIQSRDRGLSGGEFVLSVACAQLLGQDALVGLDRVRADTAGQELSPVATPASTTAGSLARRFGPAQQAGIEGAASKLASRWLGLLPARRRVPLVLRRPTIDLDSTDVEVFGRAKAGVAYNYLGQRAGRPHLASRAFRTWVAVGQRAWHAAAEVGVVRCVEVSPRLARMLAGRGSGVR